jgi:phospholipase/lecithinase/hemolysin
MYRMLRWCLPFLALLCCLTGAQAQSQAYTSIVIFGDSLSDTGNDTTVSAAQYGTSNAVPSPGSGYATGRFTDGTDSLPTAKAYYGVWIEQLAKMFPNPITINYSLNTAPSGGTNYAYGFATTAGGQSTFTYPPPNQALSFQVNNMATQVASYLNTNPTITNKTLFVVWGGANDLIAASTSATPAADVQAAAQRDAALVQTLINAGATDFIIPNLPPLGLVPRFNGSTTTSAAATQLASLFDQYLASYIAAIPAANTGKTLHLYQLDTYTLFNTIVANPSARGFANVTASSSAAKTGITTINPDTYLFWDDLHPTTYGHYQLALSAMSLMGTPVTTTTSLSTSNSQPNPGKNFTLTATVTSASGIPQGTVTFFDGGNAIGSAYVTGSNTMGTATLTTAYANGGTHTLTASFTGANGYANSTTTTNTNILVVAPTLNSTLSATTLIGAAGSNFTDTLTLTPQGGYSGTVTLACGSLPAHFTCSLSPATISLSGNNTATSSQILIGTLVQSSLNRAHELDNRKGEEIVLACGLLPGLGLLGFAGIRRRKQTLGKLILSGAFFLLAGASVLGMSGCANSAPPPTAAPGNYTVPVIVTSNGTSTTLNIALTLQ